jgi:hypothetical protein
MINAVQATLPQLKKVCALKQRLEVLKTELDTVIQSFEKSTKTPAQKAWATRHQNMRGKRAYHWHTLPSPQFLRRRAHLSASSRQVNSALRMWANIE